MRKLTGVLCPSGALFAPVCAYANANDVARHDVQVLDHETVVHMNGGLDLTREVTAILNAN